MKITTILLAVALMGGVTNAMGQEQMMPVQQEQTPDVSDQELQKFANIYMEVQTESQKMQVQAAEAIQAEGMEVERFNELATAQNDPNQETEPNEKEVEILASINLKIQKIQTDFQGRVAEMVQKEGLTLQRYQELYTAVQNNQELQQKFGELISG